MSSLSQVMAEKDFVVTVEVDPPKGTDLGALLDLASAIGGRADALVVSDNAGAVARLDPVAAAVAIKAKTGGELIVTLTCRDRNRLALTSAMLAAASAGLENLLLVSGDYVTLGDHPQAKGVYDLDSVQALQLAQALAQGSDLSGGQLSGAPSFFLGAGVSPTAQPLAGQVMKLKKKLAAGARFIITMPLDEAGQFAKFKELADGAQCRLLAGLELGEGADTQAAGTLAGELKAAGATGLHLSAPGRPEALGDLLSACGR